MIDDLLRFNSKDATHRIVLLHGWGADVDDLISLGEILVEGQSVLIEGIALRAPEVVPGGLGRQWYSLFPPDWDTVPAAVSALRRRLIDLQSEKIPLEKTILLGFSQGGAMALASGCNLPLAGLIGCSAYQHPDWQFNLDRPPVLLTHGVSDEVVPFVASENLLLSLRDSCPTFADLIHFEGGHSIHQELIPRIRVAISDWLDDKL